MKNELFTKNFILLFISNFFICSSFYMIMPVLPAFASQELNIDSSKVGVVVGIFSLSAIIMRPVLGTILDRHGRISVYLIGLILFAMCCGSYVLTTSFALLIAMRVIHGISWSGVNTASSTIVADIVPAGLRGEGIGYFGLSMTVAMALGPAFGVLLIGTISYENIFLISMGVCLTALFAALFLRLPQVKLEHKKIELKNLYERSVFGLSALEFFYGIGYGAVLFFSTLIGIEKNIPNMGAFFIVFAICVGILRPKAGKIMDRRGPKWLFTIGVVFFSIGMLFLSFAYNTTTFLIAAGFSGLGSGLVMPTLMTMMINIVKPSRRGAANATFFTALDLGIGGGAIALGYIAEIVGFEMMFLLTTVMMIVPTALFYIKVLPDYNRKMSEIDRG